jgi:hypothetical protein
MGIPKEFHLATVISDDNERHELMVEYETKIDFPMIELKTRGYSIYDKSGKRIIKLESYEMIDYILENYKEYEGE